MPVPDGSPEVDEVVFREAISHFATGVTVITTVHEGRPVGMTASAVASVSLDPILLLVCISNKLPTHTAIEETRCFAVNVLGEGREDLALHFARPAPDKFAGLALAKEHDLPILEDSIAHFVCDVHELLPGGDHSIVIGAVRACAAKPGRRPLVYYRSKFGTMRDPDADLLHEAFGWDVGSLGGIAPVQVQHDRH
jgi:3-hydroxy-9,10-secoandrosta-1,3,5(10)-triene-9,17-dione monooxygenase reductase component